MLNAERKRIRLSREWNILLLISSFVLGQGIFFLGQTYLIVHLRYDLSVMLALSSSMSMLAMSVIDCGGIISLANKVISNREADKLKKNIEFFLSNLILVRIFFFVLIFVAFIIYLYVGRGSDRFFFLFAAIGIFFWCFNVSGILDGLSLSGFSGMANSIPYILVGATIPFLENLSLDVAGAVAGAAFAIGAMLGIVLQYYCCKKNLGKLKISLPDTSCFPNILKEVVKFQASFLPGQLIYRGQIIVSSSLLPASLSALYIYGKQAANAAQQIIGFSRRAAYPDLASYIYRTSDFSACDILARQKQSLALAGIFFSGMLAAGLLNLWPEAASFHDVGAALAMVSPTLLGAAIFSAIGQAYYAQEDFHILTVSAIIVLITALTLPLLLEPFLDVWAMIVGEVIAHILGLATLLLSKRRVKTLPKSHE